MPRTSRRPAPKTCAKCDAPISHPVLAAGESELCAGCAMSADPGAELAFREGSGFCKRCGGEHCPHYACTTGGGQGYCDNCSGDE